ncbi:MAG: branched-chain amino acid ABC transporter permease [Rhodobacteraceae bacterium]|nr:branched-chain amino acid ABC transporter permease [Paracoccaceae bacterium]MYE37498.1 branched-chain amino acid ABC transporter permease [Paracoccaceae bacterium]MYG41700.1 branched-chain amino acid ABC transporter permease [Paracoccaceae bacterium]
MIELLLQTGLNALFAAAYLSLVAVGLVLIFGVMGVINFAHGELFMLGAYVVVALYTNLQMPFFLVVALGLIFVGLVGILMEITMFHPLRNNPLGGLVASIGFLMVIQALIILGFGVRMEHVPPVTQDVIVISEKVRLPVQRLFVILSALVCLSALWLFLKRTKFGWALRASAQDPEAAMLQGISTRTVSIIALFIGAALAGVAGSVAAPVISISPVIGHSVIVSAFIVIIVGGIGSLEGAVLASATYAFIHTVITTFVDGVIADIVGLSLMLMVLIIKPTGMFGTQDRV